MKRILLALIVAFIVQQFPWRLVVLGAEVMIVPAETHVRITQADDEYWDALNLESRLVDLGWRVGYKRDLEFTGRTAFGVTLTSQREIWIEEALHWNNRFAILAHEGGHTFQPTWAQEEQGEVFAETVACLVTHDGFREHARYLARYKMQFIFVTLLEWRQMYQAAEMLASR